MGEIKSRQLFEVSEIGGSWILSSPDLSISVSFPMDEMSGGDKRLVYELLKRLGIHRRLQIGEFKG